MNSYYREGTKMDGQSLKPPQFQQHPGQPQYLPTRSPDVPSQHPPGFPYPTSQRSYPPAQSRYMEMDSLHSIIQTGYTDPRGPITIQPMAQAYPNWMQRPEPMRNCPPGLEYLASIDKLIIHQKLDLLELITNVQIENKYSVHNRLGQMVYHASEQSDTCTRNCCGAARSFEMIVTDNFGQEVLHFSRPCKCQCCCCFCCLQTMEVFSPPGTVIGTIEQNWNPIFPSFSLKNPSGDCVLRMIGPFCPILPCDSDLIFEIFSASGDSPVGKLTKKWTGYLREVYTNADTFKLSFPKNLDVKMKAVLLGSVFLIDMMYFERPQNTQRY